MIRKGYRLMKVLCLMFLVLCFTFYVICNLYRVYAAENFLTDYNVTYIVSPNGLTNVVMNINLTNTTSDYYYASSYKVQLGFLNLTNVRAYDSGGTITPIVTKTDSGYTIEFSFNTKVVGIGNKQTFTVTFDTSDIAQNIGKIWEVNIPGIEKQNSFHSFNVNLQVPPSFGKPVYIKPCNTQAGCNDSLQFNKEQLSASGISIAFGENQLYDYTLLYHLQNINLFPIITEIAIPSDTNYQQIYIDSIDPKPLTIKKDSDGNWLAEYEINAAKKIDIIVKGRVRISLTPVSETLTASNRKLYLQEQPYWQITDTSIKALALSLKTPQAIYNYTVKNLNYDFSRISKTNNRLGASNVLKKPSLAVCLEFTDLFIALARAAGIPAREVDGYAYTNNSRQRPLSLVEDVLHAWPEYYDDVRKSWIMVDPTWGNTTGGVDYFNILDFDHFAFIKKGVSSTYPVPAGGYKIVNDEDRKDVYVYTSINDSIPAPTLILSPVLKSSYTAGFPINVHIKITNTGPGVSSENSLTITANGLLPKYQNIYIDRLLPYEVREYNFTLQNQSFLTNRSYPITIGMAGKNYQKTIAIIPVFVSEWKIIGGTISAIFALFLFIFAIKTRRLRIS
jgi:hypothetical protein